MNLKKLDYLVASASMIFCSFLTFIYNFYIKKFVMPYEFGIFTSANLVLLYMGYLQFGVLNAFNRDYPRLLGQGNETEFKKLRNTVFTYLLLLYALIALIVIFFTVLLIKKNRITDLLGIGIIINSLVVFFNSINNFLDVSTKSEGNVIYASSIGIIKTIFLVSVGYFSVRAWNFYGMFVAIGVSTLIPFPFYLKKIFNLQFSFDKKLLYELIKSGLPLLINSLVWTVMMSVDKFVILSFMDMSDLGIYSTALLGFSTLVLIPKSISQIFYIKMSVKYGETNSTQVLLNFADQFTFIISICTSSVALIAFFMLPVIIDWFIPNYSDGIQAAKILIIGVSLYSTTMMYSNVFSVLKLNSKLLKNTIVLCILNISFSVTLVLVLGKDINYVALGTALSYSLYSIILIISLGKLLNRSIKRMVLMSWLPVLSINIPSIVFSLLFKSQFLAFSLSLIFFLIMIVFVMFYNKKLIMNFIKTE